MNIQDSAHLVFEFYIFRIPIRINTLKLFENCIKYGYW